eukprot:CAMPEP_0170948142 /NCGR_PEP_ID=MMETSP0735-20130129/28393_1 /TAXON_ID=186038 /ORGANISM="Fragilariopsis kerguelensis, Strain L26-C5" /LENGTH=95 /DNA_ID=CAMNT_0011357737 /DNA_START=411 /DNA_END=694 /DNA_ORIENTATION=-
MGVTTISGKSGNSLRMAVRVIGGAGGGGAPDFLLLSALDPALPLSDLDFLSDLVPALPLSDFSFLSDLVPALPLSDLSFLSALSDFFFDPDFFLL